jgi:hypothetical protein
MQIGCRRIRSYLSRPQLRSELVQDAVDVFEAICAAEGFGLFDVFIDDHTPWHIQAMLEFVGAHPHDGVLYRGDFQPRAIQMGLDQGIQLSGRFHTAAWIACPPNADTALAQQIRVRVCARREQLIWNETLCALLSFC